MALLKSSNNGEGRPDDQLRSNRRRRLNRMISAGVVALSLAIVALLVGLPNNLFSNHRLSHQPSTTLPTSHLDARVAAAHARIYSLPTTNPELMNPVVDAQGRVWFGEMGDNKLAMLDPTTGKVTAWTPPNGQYNIMYEVIDRQGGIWFTEAAANYVARFNPTTQTFKVYPLNTTGAGQSAGPTGIALDAVGNIWFTEATGAQLGKLDPTNGHLALYPLPNTPAGAAALPYGLAITHDGRIWYGNLSGGSVGVLNPATGKVTQYPTPSKDAEVYSLTIGPDGAVWFTQLQMNTVGRIDPATGTMTTVAIPTIVGAPATLYGAGAKGDALWLTSAGANAIIRYVPTTNQFTFYTLKTPQSVPYGLAFAPNGSLWFTADGAPNYVGAMPRQ